MPAVAVGSQFTMLTRIRIHPSWFRDMLGGDCVASWRAARHADENARVLADADAADINGTPPATSRNIRRRVPASTGPEPPGNARSTIPW